MHAEDAPPPVAELIARRAREADGPLDRAALRALGLQDGAIDHRVRTGSLRRLHSGVYVPGHDVLTGRGSLRAALAVGGPRAGLSLATAGAVHDLRASTGALVHVTVPGNGGRTLRRGDVRVHRARGLLERDVVEVDGLRVTSVAWTVRDLAATTSAVGLERLLERCEVLQLFDRAAFLDVLERGRGRKGTARLRAALTAYTGDPVMTRSELEERVLGQLVGGPLDDVLVNERVCGHEADFHWPARHLVLEVDGWETHRTRAAFERDRALDAKRHRAGWRTVRATHRQVCEEWPIVEATLLAPTAPA